MSHTLSGKFAAPLRLELGPSRALAAWLIGVHGTPLCLLPLLPLNAWLNLALVSAVCYSLLDAWCRQVRRNHPDAVRSLLWKDADRKSIV